MGTSVTVSAQGFLASHALTVTVGGTSATITSGGTTGVTGSSTVTFTVPALPAGPYSVTVSDGTNSATSATQFTVTASATGPHSDQRAQRSLGHHHRTGIHCQPRARP